MWKGLIETGSYTTPDTLVQMSVKKSGIGIGVCVSSVELVGILSMIILSLYTCARVLCEIKIKVKYPHAR